MPKRLIYTLVLLMVVMAGCGKNAEISSYSIIPEPVFVNTKEGTFTFDKKTKIYFENLGQNSETAKYINKSLRKHHIRTSLIGQSDHNCIVFSLNTTTNTEIGDEGYLLEVRTDGIYVSANTETGLFYGYQTLLQMLPEDIAAKRYSRISLPCCTILDYPAFAWRGSHLDVSRHFFSVNDVKKHLDLMAAYKLNKFHWHLTDDHGWRIEIEKYPELNDVASWRVDRSDVPWGKAEPAREGEPRTYGGFYTKEEISEIVSYAAQRHIDVIPEIEIPGHCAAILEAYPNFACANDDTTYHVEIGPYWPPRAILCGGNDSVLQFLRDVMSEIIPLFPYEYIHIGGDEAVKDNWKRCPKCQARIHELGLGSEEELQSWMIRQVENYLTLQGRKIIGWDEILDGGVSENATVMSWQGYGGAVKAAQHGNHAIMTPTDYCYYNYYQANPDHQPAAMTGLVTLYKAYQFDPIPDGLTAEQQHYILGGQCNLWTEFIFTQAEAEYMLLPRMCAMSECLWSPKAGKDWPRFRAKVARHKLRYAANALKYCEGSFKPIVSTAPAGEGHTQVSFDWEVEGMEIYYTVDGTAPDSRPENGSSTLYTKPFIVDNGCTVRTLSYYHGEVREETYDFPIGK